MWEYRCRIVNVVDGDTLDLEIDLGFRIAHEIRVRLADVNAPEMSGAEAEAGREVKERVYDWMSATGVDWKQAHGFWPVFVHTGKTDKYGRWVAEVWAEVWPEDHEDARTRDSLNLRVMQWTVEAMERHGLDRLRYGSTEEADPE